ncbi:MAG: hypothetical protein ACKV2U_31545 [Bryobacteraceae bacterium]
MRSILIALAVAAGLAAQQPNTVTANVSVSQPITTGTAVFRIQFVEAGLSSTVDSAVTVLGPASVAASQLGDVTVELSQGFMITTCNFAVPVPAGRNLKTLRVVSGGAEPY